MVNRAEQENQSQKEVPLTEQVALLRAENEALRRELLHRTSNNLQLVSSMLDLAGKRFREPEVVNRLAEVRTKIQALGLVQTQAYDHMDSEHIDMERFLQNLVLEVGQLFYRKNVAAHLDCQPVKLPLEQAAPLALVYNELITNAFKHPFQTRKSGRIGIELNETDDGLIRGRVRDNGTGLPDGVDVYQTDTLGLKLVRNIILVQFKGKLKVRRQRGTGFRFKFKKLS